MINTLKDELIHVGAVGAASILMAALVKCPQPLLAGGILAGVTYGSDRFFRVPGSSQLSGNAGLAVNAAAGLFTELTKQPILLAAGIVTPLFFNLVATSCRVLLSGSRGRLLASVARSTSQRWMFRP